MKNNSSFSAYPGHFSCSASLIPYLLVLTLPSIRAQTGAGSKPSGAAPESGVIIEDVTDGSQGAQAGLQVNDVILSWSRGAATGKIHSLFDWADLEIEQLPRGAVTVSGLRDSIEKVWMLSNSLSGVTIRPILRPDLVLLWQMCRELEKIASFADAAEGWRAMTAQVKTTDPLWLVSWLQYQLAQSLARARRFDDADAAIQQAIEQARFAAATAPWYLLRKWCGGAERSNWVRAEECYQRSLEETRRLPSPSLTEAASLNDLGILAENRGDLGRSEDYHQRALAIQQKLAPGSFAVAASLHNLGNLAWRRGDPGRALEYHRQAVAVGQSSVPSSLSVAGSLNYMGNQFWYRGEVAQAERYYRQALAIQEKLAPGGLGVGFSLGNLGNVASSRGDLARAEDYYRQALAIRQKLTPGDPAVAAYLADLAMLASARGEVGRAEDYFEQALAIRQKLAPGSLDVAATLGRLGFVAYDRGDAAQAENYIREALAIQQKLTPGGLEVANDIYLLGKIARRRGELTRAEEYYQHALEIDEKFASGTIAGVSLAATLIGLGEVASDLGNLSRAEKYYQRALVIDQTAAFGGLGEAIALHALGVVMSRKGELDSAAANFDRAITLLERQTARLGGTDGVRSGFRAEYAAWYLQLEDALLAQKHLQQAYEVSERSRARSLLQMLAERDLVFAADVPADLERARRRNAATYDRVQAQITDLNLTREQKKLDELVIRLRELNAEREEISEQIKKSAPHFAALQYPQPLGLTATRQVLDPGTTLLSYSVGEEHTVLFVVRPAGSEPGLSVFTLPVEKKELLTKVQEFRRIIEQHHQATDRNLITLSSELYNLLLKPADSVITVSDRLLIVPDGPLQILPFAALRRNGQQYLVEWKPLHSVVSATVYAELRKMRHSVNQKTLELAAFGDPVYPGQSSAEKRSTADPDLGFAEERGYAFRRLPFSRGEVETITAMYAGRSKAYLGAEATEEHAKSIGGNVRYIHFATHGFLDERFPLNSALVLTIPQKVAEGGDNGLLQAWEIFEQMRIDADLVTLSACNTALGQQMSGEGLVGLTRAFQYAGAHSILASLWSVEDFWTMRLMELFYGQLRAGKSKDEGLRQAQLSLLRQPGSSSPSRWAAFTLIGDWR